MWIVRWARDVLPGEHTREPVRVGRHATADSVAKTVNHPSLHLHLQQSAGTLDLCSMQIRASAFEGELVSLADSLALTGSATLDGLTAQGNVGCDQLLRNDVNCTDVFTTGVDASGQSPAHRSQPPAPSPSRAVVHLQGPCQAAC